MTREERALEKLAGWVVLLAEDYPAILDLFCALEDHVNRQASALERARALSKAHVKERLRRMTRSI